MTIKPEPRSVFPPVSGGRQRDDGEHDIFKQPRHYPNAKR